MTTQMYICLAIFVFMIGGYVLARKLHTTNGVVALCAIILTTYSGLVPASKVLGNFANANVLLITGMFIVSAGFNRTQAVNKMSSLVAKISGGKFSVMLIGYCLVTFLLTNFIPSPVAVFTIVSPMLVASCYGLDVSPSKAVYSIGLVAIGTCNTLPIGSGAATYATQNGYMESYGYTAHQMELLDPFKGRILISLFILVYAMFIAPKFAPAEPSTPLANAPAKKGSGNEQPPLDPVREFLGYAIFIATTLGLVFSSKLGLVNWQVAMTGAALVVATGVLKPKEATGAMPIQIVLMLVAALSVGGAMVECGLGQLIGDTLASALGGTTSNYVVGAAFFIIPFLLTQVMQNQSVSNIFIPIIILTCQALNANPVGPLILLQAASLTAFLTPSATASVGLMMGAGGYDQKDLFKMGWLPSLLISIVAVTAVMTIFPAFP